MKFSVSLLCTALLFASGCAQQPASQPDLSAFEVAAPRSILVVPVNNNSLDVDAPDYMLSALPRPLADKGYYVFPVNTTRVVLQQEGFYEGGQIHQQPPEALAKLFDADAVLFVTIERWDAQYVVLSTTVTVEFSYRMYARDGAEIWTANQRMVYTPDNNNNNTGNPLGNLIAAAVSAAITRAAPNYMPLARQANQQVFNQPRTAIPDGPYKRQSTKR